ncbi:MAG: hypothetical protein HFJ36_03985 [Clostridia bacterium]|nr:hypothetical protein [Clostridia bacterium]
MNKKTKDVLDIILGVLYGICIFIFIICYLDAIRGDLIPNVLSIPSIILSVFINININKIFKLEDKAQKIAYNIFFYMMILILGSILCAYVNFIIVNIIHKILPILTLLLSVFIIIKDKDIKRPLLSIFILDIAMIIADLMY